VTKYDQTLFNCWTIKKRRTNLDGSNFKKIFDFEEKKVFIGSVTQFVSLFSFVVKSVSDFVTNDDADRPEVDVLRDIVCVERTLKNSGRKFHVIVFRIVECVNLSTI